MGGAAPIGIATAAAAAIATSAAAATMGASEHKDVRIVQCA